MPLHIITGYKNRKDIDSAKVIYCGTDGDKAKQHLDAPNDKLPYREQYIRPAASRRHSDEPSAEQVILEAKAAEAEAEAVPEPEAPETAPAPIGE